MSIRIDCLFDSDGITQALNTYCKKCYPNRKSISDLENFKRSLLVSDGQKTREITALREKINQDFAKFQKILQEKYQNIDFLSRENQDLKQKLEKEEEKFNKMKEKFRERLDQINKEKDVVLARSRPKEEDLTKPETPLCRGHPQGVLKTPLPTESNLKTLQFRRRIFC
jgi:DNA repair exonuclease SbcCD ATPase subunit